jgi:hypothetical protein
MHGISEGRGRFRERNAVLALVLKRLVLVPLEIHAMS